MLSVHFQISSLLLEMFGPEHERIKGWQKTFRIFLFEKSTIDTKWVRCILIICFLTGAWVCGYVIPDLYLNIFVENQVTKTLTIKELLKFNSDYCFLFRLIKLNFFY